MARILLTTDEKVEIIKIVGENVRSSREAAEEFNLRHPLRQPIHHGTIARICHLFNTTGNVLKPRVHLNRRHEEDNVILAAFNANPTTSLRNMARDLNLSVSKIWRCLKRHKLQPFKPKFLHTLEEGDEERRLEYCLWIQGNYLNNRDFLKKVIFTDEATFSTNGVVSSQNSRYWAVENPDWVINCKRQYSQKVNVWCGIFNETIIGPFFFFQNINALHLRQFLNNDLWNAIVDFPLEQLYFQLDGASIHNSVVVRAWMNENFPQRWIGRNSPLIHWPPRSPDLTPMDFYFWGHIKNKVYKTSPQNVEQLCERIRQACLEVTAQELRRVVINNRKRIEKCITLEGGLVERGRI